MSRGVTDGASIAPTVGVLCKQLKFSCTCQFKKRTGQRTIINDTKNVAKTRTIYKNSAFCENSYLQAVK